MSLENYITTLSQHGTHRVVATFVGYTGAFQEHQVLYTGTGSKVFVQTVNDALADYVPCVRSYGASR